MTENDPAYFEARGLTTAEYAVIVYEYGREPTEDEIRIITAIPRTHRSFLGRDERPVWLRHYREARDDGMNHYEATAWATFRLRSMVGQLQVTGVTFRRFLDALLERFRR